MVFASTWAEAAAFSFRNRTTAAASSSTTTGDIVSSS
ncbi:hypothetical protein CCACVL1_18592 [Corchorus capsularis]|uniref:Uncharacterized protein n=1 Tax=Corchorus capsularis TaxID=210143 RepID=A0A1R3HKW4_COCAP|nr:hypothetical protein CCACVL1_18592 [Corchorus capsularis]